MKADADPLFVLKQLCYAYGDEPVLDIESLELYPREIAALVGENGSGKTTLLKLINGLLVPGGGSVGYRGSDLTQGLRLLREESVLVHQDPYLFGGTVQHNVAYGLKIRKCPRQRIRKKVQDTLALVGLKDFEHRRCQELSGGERQRVAIARALVLQPRVLLLDEPTASIDRNNIRQMEELLLRLSKLGNTVILSSHNLAFAYRVCDRLINLEGGKILPRQINLFKGSIVETDDRFSYFRTQGVRIHCPGQAGFFSTAVLPLDDVILSKKSIETSAQNQFHGTVVGVRPEPPRYRVTLDCGFSIEAFVTEYSIEQLDVKIGADFFVTFKASAVALY